MYSSDTFYITYCVVAIILYVLLVIGLYKMFVKAGEPGWKAIIPIYNTYIMFKISWKTSMFWIYFFTVLVGTVLGQVVSVMSVASPAETTGLILAIIAFILLIIAVVVNVIMCHRLSKSYGHGVGYTLGLIFLNLIFILILGLGSSQYKKLED